MKSKVNGAEKIFKERKLFETETGIVMSGLIWIRYEAVGLLEGEAERRCCVFVFLFDLFFFFLDCFVELLVLFFRCLSRYLLRRRLLLKQLFSFWKRRGCFGPSWSFLPKVEIEDGRRQIGVEKFFFRPLSESIR